LAQDSKADDWLSFVVRARGSMGSVMAGVRQTMAELDGGMLVEFRVLDLQIAKSVLRERLMANLTGGFGLLAAILATIGLYGVMSYMVARRRNEIGLRMALGAKSRDILRLVFGEAGRLLLIGLGVGLAGSWALSRYAESLLFGLEPNDTVTLALGCLLLALTGAAASLMPARRATGLDPSAVLRDE
jgi:ABC-type antimicrobial peptide transport system permease subunit